MSEGSTWRDARPRKCGLCGSQWPTERLELVERLIRAERARGVAEAELSRRIGAEERWRASHPDVAALQDRIGELEEIVRRQNEKLTRRRAS